MFTRYTMPPYKRRRDDRNLRYIMAHKNAAVGHSLIPRAPGQMVAYRNERNANLRETAYTHNGKMIRNYVDPMPTRHQRPGHRKIPAIMENNYHPGFDVDDWSTESSYEPSESSWTSTTGSTGSSSSRSTDEDPEPPDDDPPPVPPVPPPVPPPPVPPIPVPPVPPVPPPVPPPDHVPWWQYMLGGAAAAAALAGASYADRNRGGEGVKSEYEDAEPEEEPDPRAEERRQGKKKKTVEQEVEEADERHAREIEDAELYGNDLVSNGGGVFSDAGRDARAAEHAQYYRERDARMAIHAAEVLNGQEVPDGSADIDLGHQINDAEVPYGAGFNGDWEAAHGGPAPDPHAFDAPFSYPTVEEGDISVDWDQQVPTGVDAATGVDWGTSTTFTVSPNQGPFGGPSGNRRERRARARDGTPDHTVPVNRFADAMNVVGTVVSVGLTAAAAARGIQQGTNPHGSPP